MWFFFIFEGLNESNNDCIWLTLEMSRNVIYDVSPVLKTGSLYWFRFYVYFIFRFLLFLRIKIRV